MDPAPLQRMLQAARAEGIASLAAFLGLCLAYADTARREIRGHVLPSATRGVERNIPPAVAAQRLGISLRKLTRERFTTYRGICVQIEGQSRGYVVNERSLDGYLARQRDGR